jgi:hypothetical protein
MTLPAIRRHCEERSDEAIRSRGVTLECFAALATTGILCTENQDARDAQGENE